jgi:hypothetical protein
MRRAGNIGEQWGELSPALEATRKQLRETSVRVARWVLEDADGAELVSEEWKRREVEIEAAFKAGDVDRAVRAIKQWERHARRVLLRENDGG